MKKKIKIKSNRIYRHQRIRRKVSGTQDRPRLALYRSLNHLEVQLVNDLEKKTLMSLSTRDKEFNSDVKYRGNVKASRDLGKAFAEKAIKGGYSAVVFDRGGFLYHGRLRAFADAARESGLKF